MKKVTRRRKAKPNHLLGIGLDNEDGHKRLTSAEQFTVVGGSEETHTRATETLTLLRETCTEQGAALLLVSHDREILGQFDHVVDFTQLNQPGAG